MYKKIVFYAMIVIFSALLVFNLSNVDFDNLQYEENVGPLLGATSNILFIIAMFFISKGIGKKKKG